MLEQLNELLFADEVMTANVNAADSYAHLDYALAWFRQRNPRYANYDRYYDGDHPLTFATDKFRHAFGDLFRKFADNLCPAIVDAAADRMRITGFHVPDNLDLSKQLWEFWTQKRMDRKASQVHNEAFKMGDAYLIVWPNNEGMPEFYPQMAHQVCVYYGEDADVPDWAVKMWRADTGQYRANIYYPTHIEKYITTSAIKGGLPTRSNAFRRHVDPRETWPVYNAYGRVPVFHFANNPGMRAFGQSELKDVTPIQDALNKAVADMLVAMEFVALPQRWATGLEVETDPATGRPKSVPFEAGVDRVWSTGDPETKFGQFEQANLNFFVQVQNDLRLEMARVSKTPMHYLSVSSGVQSAFTASMYPSVESQKTAEAPFASKIQDRQMVFGDVWEDAIRFAMQIVGDALPMSVETMWESPVAKSPKEEAETNSLKAANLHIPDEVLWAEMGYTEEQIKEMVRLRDEAMKRTAEMQKLSRPMPGQNTQQDTPRGQDDNTE